MGWTALLRIMLNVEWRNRLESPNSVTLVKKTGRQFYSVLRIAIGMISGFKKNIWISHTAISENTTDRYFEWCGEIRRSCCYEKRRMKNFHKSTEASIEILKRPAPFSLLENKFWRLKFYMTQFLTEHGYFRQCC